MDQDEQRDFAEERANAELLHPMDELDEPSYVGSLAEEIATVTQGMAAARSADTTLPAGVNGRIRDDRGNVLSFSRHGGAVAIHDQYGDVETLPTYLFDALSTHHGWEILRDDREYWVAFPESGEVWGPYPTKAQAVARVSESLTRDLVTVAHVTTSEAEAITKAGE